MKLKPHVKISIVLVAALAIGYIKNADFSSDETIQVSTEEEAPQIGTQEAVIPSNTTAPAQNVIRPPKSKAEAIKRRRTTRAEQVDPKYYNPYAELTETMRQKRKNAPPPSANDNNPAPKRNLYFETLSKQLKELQGQNKKAAEEKKEETKEELPEDVVVPTSEAIPEEIIEDDEFLEEENLDDEAIDAEIERILLEEEGLLE